MQSESWIKIKKRVCKLRVSTSSMHWKSQPQTTISMDDTYWHCCRMWSLTVTLPDEAVLKKYLLKTLSWRPKGKIQHDKMNTKTVFCFPVSKINFTIFTSMLSFNVNKTSGRKANDIKTYKMTKRLELMDEIIWNIVGLLTSTIAGIWEYVGSSSSGDPPMKNRRISGIWPFPIGLHVSTSSV